jgi:L-aminopeptidase/D-esterase-like protein
MDPGSITDIAGLAVGHAAAAGRATGCTVVLCPDGATCGVAVRGGSPGTRETDLLRPEATVDRVHAVLLTGGSAFGLAAATGVMRWLDEHGHGLLVGPARVPIVPAAVLFDLWLGDARIRPGEAEGYAACAAASNAPPAQGCHGAGLGATVGKSFGIARAMKGGIGSASLRVGDVTVGALVVVNAIGDVYDARDAGGRILAGARTADGRALLGATPALLAGANRMRPRAGRATTVGIVATDVALTKPQATQLAGLAHHGLARAIDPITAHDGDTLFALGTGRAAAPADVTLLGVMAAEAVARAIRNGVRAAVALAEPALPAARDF